MCSNFTLKHEKKVDMALFQYFLCKKRDNNENLTLELSAGNEVETLFKINSSFIDLRTGYTGRKNCTSGFITSTLNVNSFVIVQ